VWDLKVSERKPTAADVLQVLLYWMIVRDDAELGAGITHIGLINPRLGAVWRVAVGSIPADVVATVAAVGMAHPGELRG
jgi:hypothetical protein